MNAEPNSITFSASSGTWVMRITADRRIEVNEDVDVTEAAQTVLDALQHMLTPRAVKTYHEGKPVYVASRLRTFDDYGNKIV
jgi:hypothetical protein